MIKLSFPDSNCEVSNFIYASPVFLYSLVVTKDCTGGWITGHKMLLATSTWQCVIRLEPNTITKIKVEMTRTLTGTRLVQLKWLVWKFSSFELSLHHSFSLNFSKSCDMYTTRIIQNTKYSFLYDCFLLLHLSLNILFQPIFIYPRLHQFVIIHLFY